MRFTLPILPLLSLALIATSSSLVRRDVPKCKTLEAESNNGGRKIAIVIDESGSMASNDPYNLRIGAGKAVNDWLVSSGEAGGDKKADLVSVIGFDYDVRLYYPLGDPSGADKALDNITIIGGTYIAGGVAEAIRELTSSGNDPTANRSGIVVFTDGADSDTLELVEMIDEAGQKGIRVSFGFLQDLGVGYQDPDILKAILGTGGMYATINGATAQNAFANLMIVHGLTDDDNPEPKNSTTVYNGLSIAFTLDSAGKSTVVYSAESGEELTFTISSVGAGDLNVTAVDANGKELNSTSVQESFYSGDELVVKAQSTGGLRIRVEGEPGLPDPLFTVGVNSSIPLTNCTLGDPKSSGLTTGAKAGIGVGVPLAIGLMGLGSYLAWKYFKGLPPKAPPGPAPDAPPMDHKAPYVHTTDVQPTPQPTDTRPDWPHPPPTPPKPYHSPGTEHPNQQPFNQQNPSHGPQVDPSHPTQADPSHPTQADPSHPTQADPSHPTQADPYHPTQADPSHHPTQADPTHHPTQADPSHPTQCDPSHPTQADPSHPTQADPSHPTQADPSHPTQADPSHPTQADPSHPTEKDHNPYHPPQTDTNPNGPPQGNPNQPPMTDTNHNPPPQGDPNQPPQDPNDPRPKRVQTPRFPLRFFGRRKKDDKKDENQNQNQQQHQNQNQPPAQQQQYQQQPQPTYQQQQYAPQQQQQQQPQMQYNPQGNGTPSYNYNIPGALPQGTYSPYYTTNNNSNNNYQLQSQAPQPQYTNPNQQPYTPVPIPGAYQQGSPYPNPQAGQQQQPYQVQYPPSVYGTPMTTPAQSGVPQSYQYPPSAPVPAPGNYPTNQPRQVTIQQQTYSNQEQQELPAPQARYYATGQQGQQQQQELPAGTSNSTNQQGYIDRETHNVSPLGQQSERQQEGYFGGSVGRKPVGSAF